MVSTLDFESSGPSSSLGRTRLFSKYTLSLLSFYYFDLLLLHCIDIIIAQNNMVRALFQPNFKELFLSLCVLEQEEANCDISGINNIMVVFEKL